MANLNSVETTVSVAGKKVHFTRLNLIQKFNAHHYVEIEIDHQEFSEKWMEEPTVQINYIGQDINITMKHKVSGEENLFAGIVTNVSFTGYHGRQNFGGYNRSKSHDKIGRQAFIRRMLPRS